MTQSERHQLRQWRRYEFIRDFGLANAEKNPHECAHAMIEAGLLTDGRGMRGVINGVMTICRDMRKGWNPKPIEARSRDVMRLLAGKITGDTVSCVNLSPDESALLWSAVQRWNREHQE